MADNERSGMKQAYGKKDMGPQCNIFLDRMMTHIE